MKKRLLIAALGVFLIVAVALAVGLWLAKGQLTPDSLVRRLEAEKNCRARLDGCVASLFPPRVTLTGLLLVPRDAEADAAKPLASRAAIADVNDTVIRCGTADVELSLWALAMQKLDVTNLLFKDVEVKFNIFANGDNSLKALFEKPETVAGQPNPKAAKHADPAEKTAKKEKKEKPAPKPATVEGDEEPEGPRFQASDLGLPASLKLAKLENARIKVRNKKTKSAFELYGLNLTLSDIAVDPGNLAKDNRASLELATHLAVDSRKVEKLRYCDLNLTAGGKITPFDPATGFLNPDTLVEVGILKGSLLQGLPVFDKFQSKLEPLAAVGIKLPLINGKTTTQTDARLKVNVYDNILRVTDDVPLTFEDYGLTLRAGSWLDLATENHQFTSVLTASEVHSAKALGDAKSFLTGTLGQPGEKIYQKVVDVMVRENRLSLEFLSTEDIGKPKVELQGPLAKPKELLKEALSGVLGGVLDGFLNKKDDKKDDKKKGKDEPDAK